MNIWEYFEIEPTSDERIIKRAYAKKLKSIKHEQNNEEFMELRSAYEELIDFVRNHNESPFSEEETERKEEEKCSNLEEEHQNEYKFHAINEKFVFNNTTIDQTYTYTEESIYDSVQHLKNKCIFLLNSKKKRKSEAAWKEILYNERLWNFKVKELFTDEIFTIFIKMNPFKKPFMLPKNIINMIDEFCMWRARELDLYKNYPMEQVDFLFNNLHKLSEPPTKECSVIKRALMMAEQILHTGIYIILPIRDIEAIELERKIITISGYMILALGFYNLIIAAQEGCSIFNWLFMFVMGCGLIKNSRNFCIFSTITSLSLVCIWMFFNDTPDYFDKYSLIAFLVFSFRSFNSMLIQNKVEGIKINLRRDVPVFQFFIGIAVTAISILTFILCILVQQETTYTEKSDFSLKYDDERFPVDFQDVNNIDSAEGKIQSFENWYKFVLEQKGDKEDEH